MCVRLFAVLMSIIGCLPGCVRPQGARCD